LCAAEGHPHLGKMFDNILMDLAKITGMTEGKNRKNIDVNRNYEAENAGSWVYIK
jgi:hypothetical protein